jgi:hypothetical protein
MQKSIPILIIFLLCSSGLYAQSAGWQWGKRGGSVGSETGALSAEQVLDMATDPHGNIYVLAVNNPDQAHVDGHLGIGNHDRRTLASWTCDGSFRWMKNFGGGQGCDAVALGTDSLGGVYISGSIYSTISVGGEPGYFDTDSVLNYMSKTMYIIKYDTAGIFQWLNMPQPDTVNIATGSFTGCMDMDVAPNGDIYLYSHLTPGNYNGTSFIVSSNGFFILKYDKDGTFVQGTPLDISVSTTPGWGPDLVNAANAYFKRDHNSGRYYLGGYYNAYFGGMSFGTTVFTGSDYVPVMYLAAFDPAGNSLWVKQGDSFATVNSRPAIDEWGRIYIAGSCVPGCNFNGHTFNNSFGPHMVPFLIAVDSNGDNIWATSAATKGGTTAFGPSYANNVVSVAALYGVKMQWDSLEITGPFNMNYVYLARFEAATGHIISLDSITGGSFGNGATAITADHNGNQYVGGSFSYQLYPADDTLTKIGGTLDWFVAKFGSENCNCDVPVPAFSWSNPGNNTLGFNYTGSSYTGISWDFGDGSSPSAAASPTHTFPDSGSYIVCVTVSNDCGSNTTCKTVHTGQTGIRDIAGLEQIRFYPNPATETIVIEHAQAGMLLNMFTMTGSRVLHTRLQRETNRIKVRDLAPGIYLLQFTDKAGRQRRSHFVKQ